MTIAEILRKILDNTEPPEGFDQYQERLYQIRPDRIEIVIKEAPENHRPLDDIEGIREPR